MSNTSTSRRKLRTRVLMIFTVFLVQWFVSSVGESGEVDQIVLPIELFLAFNKPRWRFLLLEHSLLHKLRKRFWFISSVGNIYERETAVDFLTQQRPQFSKTQKFKSSKKKLPPQEKEAT